MDALAPLLPKVEMEVADGLSSNAGAVFSPNIQALPPAMGGCDTIVDGSLILTARFRRLAIRRTSQGFEVVHRFAGEWVGVSYPACVRSHLEAARADLNMHVEKDADRRNDWRH